VIRTLLFYIERGASFIRLDAIGYVWKKLGSSSLHEREAHLILQIIKDVLSAVAPGVMTIAEVNEPQDEVFRYLGKKGEKEADLVYQLTHFPLAVHAILTEDGSYYMEWLKSLAPAEGRQFITVLGSHDGMGLKPVRGFLPPKEIERMVHILIEEHASLPNYAVLPGGERIVYEVCATPWHLINSPTSSEPFDVQLKRYLAVLALGLMPRGIPTIYINGLIGAPNNPGPLDEARTINRQIFNKAWLFGQLDELSSPMRRVLDGVIALLKRRASEEAFNPGGPPLRPVYLGSSSVISAILESPNGKERILGAVNVSAKKQKLEISSQVASTKSLHDIISGIKYTTKDRPLTISLEPYQVVWLKSVFKKI
jgi:sucrose phosphorylase